MVSLVIPGCVNVCTSHKMLNALFLAADCGVYFSEYINCQLTKNVSEEVSFFGRVKTSLMKEITTCRVHLL